MKVRPFAILLEFKQPVCIVREMYERTVAQCLRL